MAVKRICIKCGESFRGHGPRCLVCRIPRRRFTRPKSAQCVMCSVVVSGKGLILDHIRPLAHGGSDDPRNLQILCVSCHKKKTSKEGF